MVLNLLRYHHRERERERERERQGERVRISNYVVRGEYGEMPGFA